MMNVGDILSTIGGVHCREGYHEYHGVYLILSTVGTFAVVRRYRDPCKDHIMSTVEGVQYHGGYHILLLEYFHCACYIAHMYHAFPHGTQITNDDIPHGTEHSLGTRDISHLYHDMPHNSEHLPLFKIFPLYWTPPPS